LHLEAVLAGEITDGYLKGGDPQAEKPESQIPKPCCIKP
jgi:hypothetical protein